MSDTSLNLPEQKQDHPFSAPAQLRTSAKGRIRPAMFRYGTHWFEVSEPNGKVFSVYISAGDKRGFIESLLGKCPVMELVQDEHLVSKLREIVAMADSLT